MTPRFILLRALALCAAWLAAAAIAAPAAAAAPWWTHAVIYEIYTRSFQDTDGDGVGDLRGVTRRLDYLKSLGVDAIWLTPFYPSPNADFGYDVADYTNVAPEYGTLADWDRLAREARRRGIRVLVDLVLNHSSDQHPWFRESRASLDNPKRDWYVWRDGGPGNEPPTHWASIFGGYTWTQDPATRQWYYHIFLPQQPDLNWANPGLRQAMFDVVRFWLDHGASGFRLDATPYLFEDPAWPDDPDPKAGPPVALKPYNSGRPENHAVLRELRAILDGYPGDRVLLGESATATIEDLAGVYGRNHDEINLPMNFLIGNLSRLDATAFKQRFDEAELKLGGQTPVLFFSNHDHSRQWSGFGDGVHNDQIAKLTATLTLTARGTALLYYGEELGMGDLPAAQLSAFPLGVHRPRADERDRARAPMPWQPGPGAGFTQGAPWLPIEPRAAHCNVEDERHDPASLYHWYAQLLRLRRSNAALREGDYLPLESGNPQVFAFARMVRGRGALVVVNASDQSQLVHLSGWPGRMPSPERVLIASPAAGPPALAALRIAPFGVLITAIRGVNAATMGP